MSIAEEDVRPLSRGKKLSRSEFLRIWERHPEIKRAELIGGVVFMPSPLSSAHAKKDFHAAGWLLHYNAYTPGTEGGTNATTLILDDSPQPDINLRILPECGGVSWIEQGYLAGVPEMFTEICVSSAAYDLHEKLDLYQAAKIPEYLAILVKEHEIRWHILKDGVYQLLPPDADGIHRSRIFPGLWLDGAALLAGDLARLLAKLDEGLRSPEHQAFVEKLARNRQI